MDRRQYERVEVRLLAAFLRTVLSDTRPEGHGLILDVSTKGCRVRGTKPAKPGEYLSLTINLEGQAPPLAVELAAVRWAGAGEFGVEFIRMADREQARLRNYLEVTGTYRVLPSDPPSVELPDRDPVQARAAGGSPGCGPRSGP